MIVANLEQLIVCNDSRKKTHNNYQMLSDQFSYCDIATIEFRTGEHSTRVV